MRNGPKTVESTKAIGFWKRQYQLPATRPQVGFDVLFGIIAPVACLIWDPGIFHGGNLLELLSRLWLFAYLEIGISIAGLAYYLLARRASSFLAGILFAGAAFALAVGVVIFPLAIVGISAIIGVFGLTPFLTAFVFLRNARRCWGRSAAPARLSAVVVATSAAVLSLSAAMGIHLETVRISNRALVMLQSGSDTDFAHAVKTLKWIRFAVDADDMVIAYANTKDVKQRERISRAFQQVTGERIEDRVARLND